MLNNRLGLIGFLAIFNLPLCLYYSTFFAPAFDKSPWFVLVTYALAAIGHFCLYFLIGTFILILLPSLFKKKSSLLFVLWCVIVLTLMQIVLAVDAHVFSLYRFHLNYAMLDLFFNAQGQVISFSSDTTFSILLEVVAIIVYCALALGLAAFCAIKGFHSKKFVITCVIFYVIANLIHAYAFPNGILTLTEIQNRLPLYKPLTMNSTLIKLGIISREDLANAKISVSKDGLFAYPKAPLAYNGTKEDLNVLYIYIDALRGDMLTQEIMPNTWALSRDEAFIFRDHQSSSNSTRGGIFGAFYGLPPSYWQVALSSGIPSSTVKAVLDNNYRLGVFTSATVTKPEFNKTVFAGVENLRVSSSGENIFERDAQCISDFEKFVKEDKTKRFFSFIFLDNVHSAAVPEDAPKPFEPSLKMVNHLELDENTDPTPYFNLYKNAVYFADSNIKKILDFLVTEDLMKNTVIIISSDHGEEFNDNKDNYWGHNSNFTQAQMHIPLVVKWPGMGGGNISRRTTAYDLTATILPRIFGVSNPLSDFTIGQDLFTGKREPYYLAGSYLENAVIEDDRIVLIDSVGMLKFLDNHYQPSEDITRDAHLLEAIATFGEYLKKD